MIVVHCAVYNAPCFSVGAVYSLPRAPPRVSHRVNSDIACCALRNVYCFGVERVLDFVSYSSVAIRHFTALENERPVHEQGCCRSDHAGIS